MEIYAEKEGTNINCLPEYFIDLQELTNEKSSFILVIEVITFKDRSKQRRLQRNTTVRVSFSATALLLTYTAVIIFFSQSFLGTNIIEVW